MGTLGLDNPQFAALAERWARAVDAASVPEPEEVHLPPLAEDGSNRCSGCAERGRPRPLVPLRRERPVRSIDDVDTAAVDPCPQCGKPTRRMGNVVIAGNGLDGIRSGPWWCASCLREKAAAAVDLVRARAAQEG